MCQTACRNGLMRCYGLMVHSHTRCAGLGWHEMGCAGNSVYFNEGVHTLSYQHSQYHSVPSYPISLCSVCVWMHHKGSFTPDTLRNAGTATQCYTSAVNVSTCGATHRNAPHPAWTNVKWTRSSLLASFLKLDIIIMQITKRRQIG